MGKHAYLILAHTNFEQLNKLLKCIDNERNDIFIHIDAKSNCPKNVISKNISKSSIFFSDRIKVYWGSFSIVKATLMLLEQATKTDKYDYYHFLSGYDLPLKSQEHILNFFDRHQGKNFISLEECDTYHPFLSRIQYYYFAHECTSRNSFFSRLEKKLSIPFQKLIGIDRTRNINNKIGFGSQFFDITDDFARFVLSKKDKLYKTYNHTLCCDEFFLQTLFLSYNNDNKFHNPSNQHQYIQPRDFDILRAIDWKRGNPYVYKSDDFDLLMKSGCLFARKFDCHTDSEIIDKIVERVTENK